MSARRDNSRRAEAQATETLLSLIGEDVAAGPTHAFVRCRDGRSFALGANDRGQLGFGPGAAGADHGIVATPTRDSLHFASISCGAEHSAAVDAAGRLFVWGAGGQHRLGTGSAEALAAPHLVRVAQPMAPHVALRVHAVACGAAHTLAVTEGGRLFGWGANDDGQLGCGDSAMRPRPEACGGGSLPAVAAIACGALHSVAVTRAGVVFAW